MPFNVKAAGVWQAVAKVHARVAGAWLNAQQVWGYAAGGWRSAWQNEIRYINTSARTGASIFALMGSPTQAGNYIFENRAVISAGTGSFALRTGVFPAGSTLHIINKSTIRGRGGAGGAYNAVGSAGGNAFYTDFPCTIDNGEGYIYGGGGGGGGVSGTLTLDGQTAYIRAGGGGGSGSTAGGGGSGTARSGGSVTQPKAGTSSAGGSGGYAATGGAQNWVRGGAGGGLGASGGTSTRGGSDYKVTTRVGGAGGGAVAKNGKAVTITAGNNTTRIKGAVS